MPKKDSDTPVVKAYLDDPDVMEWYTTLHLRSETTASNYLASMARVWHHMGVTPPESVVGTQAELDRFGQRVINHFATKPTETGGRISEAMIKKYRCALTSWIRFNGRKIETQLIIPRLPKRPRASKQFIPTVAQLRAVLDAADPRTRFSIALMAFSGPRPEVQASFEGDRGIRLGHIDGLNIDGASVTVERLPLTLRIEDESTKTGRAYYTHLGPEGAEYLLAYLKKRIEAGETLTLESPLFQRKKNSNNKGKPFVVTATVEARIREVHKAAGLQAPPYIWRSYFDTNVMHAEAKGLIIRDYRQFLMGHSGDIEAIYTVRKTLPSHVKKGIEDCYMKCLKYLETRHSADREDAALGAFQAILAGLGCTEDEIAAVEPDDPDAEAIQALVEQKLAALTATAPESAPAAVAAPLGPQQRLVDVDDVEAWLNDGWTWAYNAPVPPGKALVEASGPVMAGAMAAPTDAPVPA